MNSSFESTVEIWGGIECTINRVGNNYFDQLEYSGHRDRADDIDLFASLGLKKMRYPILWESHRREENNAINWKQTDAKLQALRSHNIDVIAGLVHHGSGPAWVEITGDSFANGLANFAAEVAERYPWINYYTPVNEPLTTARFCGLYGLWYPHQKSDAAFCRILINECKATVMAMAAIRVFNANAKLVQTEDLSKIHSTPLLAYQAEFENERRWLSYDLLCGKVDSHHSLWEYLRKHGIADDELTFFTANPCPPDILGANYYLTSERYLDERKKNYPVHTHGSNDRHTYADVEAVRVGKVRTDGIRLLLKTEWERFGIPIAVTEVHLHCTRDEQMRWLNSVWEAANHLAGEGISLVAIAPWALLGSFGWNRLLTEPGGSYEPGVFDISSGYPRPTVLSQMIMHYSNSKLFKHPVLDSPGWWMRHCRATYGHDIFSLSVKSSGKALFIMGAQTTVLQEICKARCLDVVETRDTKSNSGIIWATIIADEYIEVYQPAHHPLIINLTGNNRHHALNAALDLFLDGESGNWEVSGAGSPAKLRAPQLQVANLVH